MSARARTGASISVRQLQSPSGPAYCVDLADQWVVCGAEAHTVRVWNFSRGAESAQRAADAKAARNSRKHKRRGAGVASSGGHAHGACAAELGGGHAQHTAPHRAPRGKTSAAAPPPSAVAAGSAASHACGGGRGAHDARALAAGHRSREPRAATARDARCRQQGCGDPGPK